MSAVQAENPPRTEVGSLAAFMAVFALALFVLLGLVVDGGRAVAARDAAMSQAEQAARVGAGQLSVSALRSGTVAVDPLAAAAAVRGFLDGNVQSEAVDVSGQTVTVHIQTSERTVILGIVGIDRISISENASATNVHGITRSD
jgi:Flp pilus assembly protein TadG